MKCLDMEQKVIMQNIDKALRDSPEYKQALKQALQDYPSMNQGLFDLALMAAYAHDAQQASVDTTSVVHSIEDQPKPPVSDGGDSGIKTASTISQCDGDSPRDELTELGQHSPDSVGGDCPAPI